MDLGSKGSRPGAQIYEALARSGFLSLSVREGQIESFTEKGAEIVGSIDEDELMRFLMKNGGSRYLEDLSETEASWKAKIEGIQVTLSARLAAGVLQAGVFAAKRPLAPTLGSEDISPSPSQVQAARAKPAFEGAPISARKAPDNRDLGFDIDPHMNVGRTVDFDDPNATPAPALTTRKTNITEIDFDDPLANVISKAPYVRRDSLPTPITGLSAPSSPPEIPVAPGAVTIPPPTPHVPELARGSGIPPEPLTTPGRMIRPAGLTVPPYEKYLRDALARSASDLYLVADRPMAVRIAGDLRPEGPSLPADQIETLANELTPPRLLDRLHEEGGCDFSLDVRGVGRFRVNVARQQTGFKIGFRIITKEIPTFESLGLPHQIVEAMHHHQGLIVVTGPTGHGKTTTLGAIVNYLNETTGHHIITVEDPIEHIHPKKKALLSQREVGTHTRSFAAALKGSLREDPEVIIVGELRDTETVRMALSASETGHLVVGTMSTPSAAKTIDRLVDLFPPADQGQVRMTLAGGLRLIIGQRLVPTVDGKLAAAVELLPGSVPLWSLIRENRTFQIPSLQQRGKGIGIFRIDDSLGDLVKAGRITRETAMRASETFGAQAVT